MRSRCRFPLRATTIVLALALPATTHAQSRAEELYAEGLEAMKSGSFDSACPAIAESFRLDPLPGALFTLAECEARRGRIAASWNHFGEFLDLVADLDDEAKSYQSERVTAAGRRRHELKKDLAWVRLHVPSNVPAGTTLEHNGKLVERQRWGEPLPVDPGEHRWVLRSEHGDVTQVVSVAKGRDYEVRFEVMAPTRPAPVSAVENSQAAPQRVDEPSSAGPAWIGGWVSLGIGAAGLATAAGVGFALIAKQDTIERHCTDGRCDEIGFAEADDVDTLDSVGTTAFVIGAVGAALGVTLLVVDVSLSVQTDGRSAFLSHEARW
jgi:hypothetical protein